MENPKSKKWIWLRRGAVALIGFLVLLVGLTLIVLPGPAMVVIPIGLSILATEFVWAQKILSRLKKKFKQLKDKIIHSDHSSLNKDL